MLYVKAYQLRQSGQGADKGEEWKAAFVHISVSMPEVITVAFVTFEDWGILERLVSLF